MNRQIEEIKLPIEEKPEIVSRNIHALRLSIIQKSDKSGINYVYNNYIQMMYKKRAERSYHLRLCISQIPKPIHFSNMQYRQAYTYDKQHKHQGLHSERTAV